MKPKVLFEDRDMLAVDKPEGLSSIPERDLAVPSAQKLLEEERREKLFIVHRLDKEVSGLLVFARNAETHRALSIAFEQRRVRKTYLAVARGVLEGEEGLIDKPIAEFGSGRMGVHETRGKMSQTEWKVIRRLHDATLVEAHPITGRRHQIRVHFYAIGHALLGDPRYGPGSGNVPRLMLHGHALAVTLGEKKIELTCEPPESFQSVVARLNSTLEPK
ncbi:MAG: RluA family pseudouridine synthase [Polyangiales bacterium]